nr:hypothetical protein Iba_chr03bCG8730 [Ipomoea batatas]
MQFKNSGQFLKPSLTFVHGICGQWSLFVGHARMLCGRLNSSW